MDQVIIYENELGGLSLCIPTGELSVEDVKRAATPKHSVIFNAADLPIKDMDFLDAWAFVDGKIVVNHDKAKNITKNRLKEQRMRFFQELDVAFLLAVENGVDTSAIVKEKQRLRDITKLVDSETTLEGLRTIRV